MAVIKGKQAATVLKDAVVLDMGDLCRQAARLREQAEQDAARIIREAEQQSTREAQETHQRAQQEGRTDGFAKGLEEGRRQGHAEALAQSKERLEALHSQWEAAIRRWDERLDELNREGRTAVLELAILAAKKIVHRVVAVDQSVIVDQTAEALAHVLRPLDVTVRVCASDRSILEEALPGLLAKLGRFQHVQVVEDEAINAGGCVISYGQGRIDATVEKQLERMVEVLTPVGTVVAGKRDDQVRPERSDQGASDGAEPSDE